MTPKLFLKDLIPPLAWRFMRSLRQNFDGSIDGLAFAPRGWRTQLPPRDAACWASFLEEERRDCEAVSRRVKDGQGPWIETGHDGGPLALETGEYIAQLAYAYVLALSAGGKKRLKVLDYGGSLGIYGWLGQALLPDSALEYHCKELPELAREGRKLSPAAIWHVDDSCLEDRYDLVILSASLQYIEGWRDFLRRAGAAARERLFLSQVPVVENVPGYVALQRLRSLTFLHHQFNRDEVLAAVRSAGLRLEREFAMGAHPRVRSAPEQPRYCGWIFRREAGA